MPTAHSRQDQTGSRLRQLSQQVQTAYNLLITPWPPFTIFLLMGGLIGGLTPLLQIEATRSLIDALAAAPPAPADRPIVELLAPYLPQLALLITTLAIQGTIYSGTIQQYLGAQLNGRVQEQFDRLFYAKVRSIPLECLENPEYHNTLARARQLVFGQTHTNVFWSLRNVQTLVANLFGCLGILWFFSAIHWGIAAIVLLASGFVLKWRAQNSRIVTNVVWGQTPLQRRRDYWQNLLLQRRAAAEIRLFGLSEFLLDKWTDLTEAMLREFVAALRRVMGRGLGFVAAETTLAGFVALVLIYLAWQGQLSVGTLVALLYASRRYLQMLGTTGGDVERLQHFFSELAHVQALWALAPQKPAGRQDPPLRLRQGIHFDGVGFTYPRQKQPTLTNINLTIRPGERIALVGENGAGKTTLVKLLLGLYRPSTGQLDADGIDLEAMAPQAWQAKTGAVFQDYLRYAFTIRDNIGFGQLAKLNDLAAIQAAARLSSAAAMVEALPEGYETRLGPEFVDGRDLSGGQWQKLALARVYLRDAPILVLDEPTSALDALAEQEVYRHFLQLAHNKTVLLVSHRLGSARLADRIVFLEQGRIVEQGSHQDLMAAKGAYAQLYAIQAEWYR